MKQTKELKPDIIKRMFSWEWLRMMPYNTEAVTKGPAASAKQCAKRNGFVVIVFELGNNRRRIIKRKNNDL